MKNIHNDKRSLEYYESIDPTIKEFCKPLNDHFGISFFVHIKVYKKTSKYLFISNDINVAKDYISNVSWSNVFFDECITTKCKYKTILWPKFPENHSIEIYFKHNYWHGITLLEDVGDAFEAWCFLTSRINNRITNFYIRHLSVLEVFIDKFRNRYSEIISESNKYLFRYYDGFGFHVPNAEDKKEGEKIQAFLKAIGYNQRNVCINGKSVSMAPMQLQCLKTLSQEGCVKGTAKKLLLSPKTVITHLDRIKEKTGIRYNTELIKFYNNKIKNELDIFIE